MSKDREWKIDTVPDLMKRITERWDEKRKEAESLQAEQKEKLKNEIKLESTIQSHLKNVRSVALRLEKEYPQLEAKIEKEKRTQIEKNSLRKKDVLSKKITLREFARIGKSEEAISVQVIKESTEELEQSLEIIRKENLEALKIEKSLCECQNMIRNLILRPAQILQQVLKDCGEITDQEIGYFLQDNYGLREDIQQVEHKLQITDGKSIAGRYVFECKTMAEAKSLQFSPLLPLSCVSKLKSELEKYEGSENISITLYVNLKDIEITSIQPRRSGAIQITQLKEVPGAKFTREKTGK